MNILESTEDAKEYFSNGDLYLLGDFVASDQSSLLQTLAITFGIVFSLALVITVAILVISDESATLTRGVKLTCKIAVFTSIAFLILTPVLYEGSKMVKDDYNRDVVEESNKNIQKAAKEMFGVDLSGNNVLIIKEVRAIGYKGMPTNVSIVDFVDYPISATNDKGEIISVTVSGSPDQRSLTVNQVKKLS